MEDFDKILYGFLFSVAGIIIGWFLNQIGQWFKVRSDQKKTFKYILYNLLETYNLFIKSDFEAYKKVIQEKVKNLIPPEEQNQETDIYIDQVFSYMIDSYFKPYLKSELSNIDTEYKNSINSLAEIDPITAYYLNGKSSILERLELMEDWMKDWANLNSNDITEIDKSSKMVMGIIKPNVFKDTQSDFEKDIKKIAWRINPVVWLKTKRVMNKINENLSKERDKEIDEIFEKLNELNN